MMMKTSLSTSFLCGILLLTSCAAFKKGPVLRQIQALEDEFNHHTALVILDPESGEYVFDYNGDKYFTPASNTKVLTFYTALQALPDSIPGLFYTETADSLIFWGTGDPSLFYEELPQSKVPDFLRTTEKQLYFSSSNFYDEHFGPGWAWDDYSYTFSSEISPLPVYGNYLTVSRPAGKDYLRLEQPFFKQFFWLGDSIADESKLIRDVGSNNIVYFPSADLKSFREQVPFRYSDHVVAQLLADTLGRPVSLISKGLPPDHKTMYSIPADSAYKVMMQESDNFIAEQLLLVSSAVLTDSLDAEKAISYALDHYLQGIPDPPVWVDGSGLSRYNLVTPRSMVWIWQQLYQKVPFEHLKQLLPAGGESGTLRNYYKNAEPYVYGKTGTLSNNHNISGFLLTKKGKLYIFAFMNNNYPAKAVPVKRKMERILREVHDNN